MTSYGFLIFVSLIVSLVGLILYLWMLSMIHSIQESLKELVRQGRSTHEERIPEDQEALNPGDLQAFLSLLAREGVRLELAPSGSAVKFSGNVMQRKHVETYRALEQQIIAHLQLRRTARSATE